MKNIKKIVSILCIICIMVSMLAVPAFAAVVKSENGKAPSGLKPGDKVVTNGGTYTITGVNKDGSYTSNKTSNDTQYTYKGGYSNSSSSNSSSSTTDYNKTGSIQSGSSDSKLSQSDQKKINDAKQEWNAADKAYKDAQAKGDTAGMKKAEADKKAANAKANGVRSDANSPLYVLGGGRNGESTEMTKDEIAKQILTNTAATAAQGNNYQQNAAFANQNERLRETLASVGDNVSYKNGDTTVTLKNGNTLLVTGKDKDGNVIGTINSTDGTKSTNITYKINDQYSQENSGKANGGFIPSTVIETNLVTGEKTERVDLVLVGSGSKGSAINYSDAIAEAIEYCEKNGMPANAYNIAGYINKHLMGSAYSVKLDENGNETEGGKIYGPNGEELKVGVKGAESRDDILGIINTILGADNAENIMRENGADVTDDFWDTYNKIKEVEQSEEMKRLKNDYMALENNIFMSDEEKAAERARLNAEAEAIRAKHGYTAGTDGSFWIPVEKTAGTVYMGNSRIPQPDPETPEDPTKKSFEIKVTWEGNGTVTPGTKKWPEGSDPSFDFIPGEDSEVIKVIVDGKEVDVKDGYDFKDIKEEHTIHVVFKDSKTYTVTATYNDGGSVSQTGNATGTSTGNGQYKNSAKYDAGKNATVTITPAEGYEVAGVTVDGVSSSSTTGCTFENLRANHTVNVVFQKINEEDKLKYHPITVTYSDGGTVKDGRGEIVKNGGGGYILEHMNAKFTFAPDDGFTVVKILIDGKEINVPSNRDGYTFIDITEAHTLHVEFDDKPILDLDTDGVKGDQVIKIDANTFQTKAGYGIEAGTVKVTSQNVTNIKVTATYDFGNGKQTVILEKVGNKWVFPKDTSSTTKARKIYVPIDTPDGDYTITYSVTAKDKGGNTVTPEAAAGANSYTIRIKGNMHEDDFTGDRR